MNLINIITSLEEKGLTVQQIADGAGCSVSLIRAIKYKQRGFHSPSWKTVDGLRRLGEKHGAKG